MLVHLNSSHWINEHIKVSDTDESVLDFDKFWKVELQSDTVFSRLIRDGIKLVQSILKSPLVALLQPRASFRGKRKNNGDAVRWTTNGHYSQEDMCGMNTLQNISEKSGVKVRVRDRPALQTDSDRKGKSASFFFS